MLTAQELRQITETSQSRIDAILAHIEPELVKRAEAGYRNYACYREVPWESKRVGYAPPPVTLVQQRLIEELKKLGYHAAMDKDGDPYVPRSLDDNDNDLHQNYVLVIKW